MVPPSSDPSKPSPATAAKPASNWRAYVLVALLTASVAGAGALLFQRSQPAPIVVHPPPTTVPASAPEATATPGAIVIFVSGAVQDPAVYELPVDARVADALHEAGGFTPDADVDAVNQAERLWDGAQVHVPTIDESSSEPSAGVSGATRSGGMVIEWSGKIDINTATLEQLVGLPGIGEVKAQAIMDGRPYASIEDLLRVDGIAEKTLEKLRDLVEAR
jgi:competence protein ComEA